MPNHVMNKLTMEGNSQKINEVIEFLGGKMDFQKILPMPEELEGTKSPVDKPNKELIKKYGYDNWYDWRCANWGTKWNAYSLGEEDAEINSFYTAWSTPQPVIEALAEKFPDVAFIVRFADEDMGYNCGYYEYWDGVLVDEAWFDNNLELACELWEEDINDYK